MMINRLELVRKLESMIVQREEKALARKAEAYKTAERARAEYVLCHGNEWGRFADRIRLRVRQGTAITIEDVPEGLRKGGGWRAEVDLFRPEKIRDADYTPQTETLTNLLAVLQASPDEFVSTSALDRMGAPMRELLRP